MPPSIVAIPARNERGRIEQCLAALAVQRDACGAPLPQGSFEVLLYVNNSDDGTADVARDFAGNMPHPVIVVSEDLPPERSNAGSARKRAMDLAVARLARSGASGGIIMTTDADSYVGPTWVAAIMLEFDKGADCVAGYIDAIPSEIVSLGPVFMDRSRVEDAYLRIIAEIYARCDPLPHDPWPNHRVSSGASLAVTAAAYLAVGGLPPQPLGEDLALTRVLERMGFRIRHSMDVCVTTSCRFDGRVTGGAADTMQHRHVIPDAPCDGEIEQALPLTRRALLKGRLRRIWESDDAVAEFFSQALEDQRRRDFRTDEPPTRSRVGGHLVAAHGPKPRAATPFAAAAAIRSAASDQTW